MASGTYSTPFYPSAVDGLVVSTDSYRSKTITSRLSSSFAYPIMTTPSRTSYIPRSYPIHPAVLRSSTGSILQRTPHPRALTTTVLRPTNLRWDSAINIVNLRTRPLINPRRSLQYPIPLAAGTQVVRPISLQSSNTYSMNNRVLVPPKFDARHFCGLAPIQENKLMIREIPSSACTRPLDR